MILIQLCVVLCVFILYNCEMEPFIVGGQYAVIEDFPYSAFLGIECNDYVDITPWICGGSIINQYLILTAAHCLHPCNKHSKISASLGHEYIYAGISASAYSFSIHEQFDEVGAVNDIGLIRLKTELKFNSKVNRVALFERPPYIEEALIAGWGVVNETTNDLINILKYTKQYVLEQDECIRLIRRVPKGSFCAADKDRSNYPAVGDSGSALVVQGYIQIGIASYKLPWLVDVVVYTDVGYFYKWIQETAERMMRC